MYILYACSEKYAPQLGISMFSLFDNNREMTRIEVFIIDDGISEYNKEMLLSMTKNFSRELTFIPAEKVEVIAKQIRLPPFHGSYTTYGKLFTDIILPEYVDKVLCLDAGDLVVTGSLQQVFDFDISDVAFSAIETTSSMRRDGQKPLQYDTVIARERKYYNAGVLWINVNRWRELNCNELILRGAIERPHFDIVDQTMINSYIPEKYVKKLPLRFNYTGFTKHKSTVDFRDYDEKEIKNAENCPVIVHWPGRLHHPCLKWALARRKSVYRSYKDRSPWKNIKDQETVWSAMCDMNYTFKDKVRTICEFYFPKIQRCIHNFLRAVG